MRVRNIRSSVKVIPTVPTKVSFPQHVSMRRNAKTPTMVVEEDIRQVAVGMEEAVDTVGEVVVNNLRAEAVHPTHTATTD